MQRFTKKNFLYPFFTFTLSLLVAFYAVYFAYQSQLKYTISLVDRLAEQQAEGLQKVVESDLHFIGAGANFFHSTEPQDWDRFPVFAEQVVSSSQTLIALQWMQRVEKQDIPAHIQQIRQTYPEFDIYTVPKDGDKTSGYIMADNQPIYTASDVYPRSTENLRVLGYYSSRERFQRVLNNITRKGEPSVSDKVRLLQDGLDREIVKTGLLVYHPVFDLENDDELIGVVIGVIRTTKYFEAIVVRTATEQDLLVQVTDMGFDAEDDPILYRSPNWNQTQGIEITKRVVLPNREWLVDFKLDRQVTHNDSVVLAAIFVSGLTIACLLSYIVLLLVRDKEHLAVLLDERTEELQFLVMHDSLTGIYNRRAFSQYLRELVRTNQGFSLITFDVDRFKLINDHFGHVAGDEMLVCVAQIVQRHLADEDLFVRMGGDEFCILSTVTDKQQLGEYLNSIRCAVAELVHTHSGQRIRCTLSIGAAIRRDEGEEDIMQASDAQLYKSKQAGRNRVSIAE
ncbi:sensor domain-containing diguanylate cyclase [Vibrio brasiliensis]|uniref:sensor domain-containing diguanylate cyclase n=1 Tax=Vibrio brasiliensis TaxID=170652 RepID=UPI001EFC3005|nr:sensor domain-containing diguanylate cyclase [Vibrio brasiliensis]MCG9752942.1 sensor domain-containing diguanylate cyclase [Vibrio brasiliensis]